VHAVLVETERAVDGLAKGFTDNYIPVHFKARPNDANRVVPVKLESLQERFVIGTPL
jgi:threonylcarbamoyladenosine tRNA methylthiotransferase MtaB